MHKDGRMKGIKRALRWHTKGTGRRSFDIYIKVEFSPFTS